MTRLAWVPIALVLVLAGCGDDDGGAAHSGTITVVATTTQAADFARNVAGSDADVRQLLAPNADPHEYEVRPQDVEAVSKADLVVRSGGDVDEWLDEAIEGSGTDAPVLDLSQGVHLEGDDPHWWQDPRNAVIAVEEIRTALDKADAAHERDYDANAKAYTGKLRSLDHHVAACIDKV